MDRLSCLKVIFSHESFDILDSIYTMRLEAKITQDQIIAATIKIPTNNMRGNSDNFPFSFAFGSEKKSSI